MLEYTSLLGKHFVHGKQDCFTLIRDFYRINFGIQIRNYARPDRWWDAGLNLYHDNFYDEGFSPVNAQPRDFRAGDLILMAIRAPVANHAAILVGGSNLIHHLPGSLSSRDTYNRPLFRDTTLAVIRHSDVTLLEPTSNTNNIELMDILPHAIRRKLTPIPAAGRT